MRSEPPATAREPLFDTAPYKVRVVEDDPAQRRLARATLAAPKYQVVEAADGRQAVERLHGEDFDVVLLDRRLPEMDGHAVLRHIRAVMDEPLLPVIMVTAHGGGGDDISLAMSLGASDFVRKPYDPLELMARVDAAVAHKRLTDQLEDAESILFAQARPAAEIIRSHHERWDGGGYPDALHGEAIPLLARVFQLVDIPTRSPSSAPTRSRCRPLKSRALSSGRPLAAGATRNSAAFFWTCCCGGRKTWNRATGKWRI